MKYKIKINIINEILISFFVLVCTIFPGDVFNIKKIIFLCILCINWKLILANLKKISFISIFGFWFPVVLIFYSVILGNNFGSSFSRTFCCFMIFLIPIIQRYNIDYKRILFNSIYVIVFFTLLFFILDFFGIYNINSSFALKDFFIENETCIMGKNPQYPLYYKIFFKTSPLVVLLLFDGLKNNKILQMIIAAVVLLLSGTRANFYFTFIFFIIYIIIYYNNKKTMLIMKGLILISAIIYIIFNYYDIYEFLFNSIVISGEKSDLVRIEHINSLINLYANNQYYFLFGMGMGSSFYSMAIDSYTSSIELAYIDLYRQMGLLFFVIFLYFVFKPLEKIKSNKSLLFAYITYLLIAFTNPLLFNSTAYLLYILVNTDEVIS